MANGVSMCVRSKFYGVMSNSVWLKVFSLMFWYTGVNFVQNRRLNIDEKSYLCVHRKNWVGVCYWLRFLMMCNDSRWWNLNIRQNVYKNVFICGVVLLAIGVLTIYLWFPVFFLEDLTFLPLCSWTNFQETK